MPPPTPAQQLRRARFEGVIGLVSPLLDLVLVAGDRLSRAVGRDDEYLPVRAPSDAFELEVKRAAERAGRRRIADPGRE